MQNPNYNNTYEKFIGDVSKDAFAVRYFLKDGHKIALAQSFAKNMGLYGTYFIHRCAIFNFVKCVMEFFY